MPELTPNGAPERPPLMRRLFAAQVHAQAHAVLALRELRAQLDACDTVAWVRQRIDADIATRCRAIGLDPDELGDALEAAAEDAALRGLREDVQDALRRVSGVAP